MMVTEVLLGVLLLVLFLVLVNRKPKGLPPGEWGWPVLGAWMPSGVTMEDHANALRQKYGDIFTWRMGSRTMVFLNNFQLIKTAFNHPDLQDRPDFFTFDAFTAFVKTDIRYEVDDREVHKFNEMIHDAFQLSQGNNLLFDMFPWLPHVSPSFIWKSLGVEAMLESFTKIKNYILQVIEEHEASLDPDKPRDYIDIYLVEMKTQQDNPESTMDKHDLWVQVADLFSAGSETTNQTLRWALMFLAKYPDLQTRVQRQIDDVVPRGTLPSLQDKPKLPYLEAVIHEVNRFVSLTPLGVMHSAAADTQLAGFSIPKGTVVIANLEMCHKDPTYWEKPDEFYPEHFLDSEGKLKLRKENYVPFSVGRRVCPGESLARMELYVFLSALLQNFTFSEPKGEPLDLRKDPATLLFNFPKPMNVLITTRA